MRHGNLVICTSVGLLVISSAAGGQDEPYRSSGGDFSPYHNSLPSNDNSMPVEYQLGNAPGDSGPDPRTFGTAPRYRQPPRRPSYWLQRDASDAPENERPDNRPRQDFGGQAIRPWGPPPDIYSIAPEGTRNPVQPPARPPRAEPVSPPAANPAFNPVDNPAVDRENNPADEAGPDTAQDQTQYEFFEPNRDHLREDYFWYQPSSWEDFGWDVTVEVGLNGSAGNSRTNSLKAGFKAERETEIHKFLFDVVHNRAATEDISTQNNVLSKLRYDRKLHESRWSLFAQGTGEYDEFKDFDMRLAASMGVNYKFIKTETTTLSGDFGSGVSHEIGGIDGSYVPEALFGLDFKHQLSKRQKLYVKFDYFPDWGDWSSYRAVTDAGWELLLDEKWGLNLKIGVIDRYDSTPGSRKPNDLDYSMLLLWKL